MSKCHRYDDKLAMSLDDLHQENNKKNFSSIFVSYSKVALTCLAAPVLKIFMYLRRIRFVNLFLYVANYHRVLNICFIQYSTNTTIDCRFAQEQIDR